MARFELILEDSADSETCTIKLNADNLRTADTMTDNTVTQNAAIMIIEILRSVGIDNGQLPDLGKISLPKKKRK